MRWSIAVLTSIAVVALIYHNAVPRTQRWHIVLPGAALATGMWFRGHFAVRMLSKFISFSECSQLDGYKLHPTAHLCGRFLPYSQRLDRLARVVLLVQLESDFFLAGDIAQEVTYAPQIEIVRFYSPSLEPR